MNKLLPVIVPLFILAASGGAQERTSADSTPFSRAREIILSTNSALAAAGLNVKAAEAGVDQAAVLPNPVASVDLDRFGIGEIEATIEQTIERGRKRRLRTEAARKEVDAAANNRLLVRSELETEIARRFVPIAAAEKKLSLLDSVILIAEAARNRLRMHVEAGASKQTDLLRAEIEIDRLNIERDEILRARTQARQSFAALGTTDEQRLYRVTGSIAEATAVPPLDTLLRAIGGHPKLKAFDIERSNLATVRQQLRAEVFPDLNVSAGYLHDNREHFGSPLVGCAITVPLFNRGVAARNRIDLQALAASMRRDDARRLIEAEVRALHDRLAAIDRCIRSLETVTIPKARLVSAMLEEHYGMGSAAFLDLATARSDLLRFRLEILDLKTERALALTELGQLTFQSFDIID